MTFSNNDNFLSRAFVVLKETDTKIPELSADIPADLFPEDDELDLDKAKKEKSKTISSAGVKVTKNEKTQKKDTSVKAADGRKSGNFVTITELNAVLAQVKERALAELRQNQERIRMEIVKKINQICQQQREQQYTHQESSNSSVSATKSSRAIAVSKLLPFNSNEDIDAFFERGSYEDEDALYNLLKTYFSELSQVVKGIKRLLSDEYRAGHLWKVAGTSVSSANPRPEMNATMREWIESMFIRPVAWENPHMAEQIKKKIQRSFTDTHAKRKMDNTENANVKTESVDYVERAISEGGANFEEANVKKIRYDATSDRIMEEDSEDNENDPIAESEDDEGDSQQNEQNITSIENNEPTMPEVTDEAGIHI